jgi:hypothetical protein
VTQRVTFELTDGRGLPVSVTAGSWRHVLTGHPEMTEDAVRVAVSDPDMVIRPRNRPKGRHIDRRINVRLGGHERYNALYVVVVVDYGAQENWLITAYLSPRPPKGDLIFVRFPVDWS